MKSFYADLREVNRVRIMENRCKRDRKKLNTATYLPGLTLVLVKLYNIKRSHTPDILLMNSAHHYEMMRKHDR